MTASTHLLAPASLAGLVGSKHLPPPPRPQSNSFFPSHDGGLFLFTIAPLTDRTTPHHKHRQWRRV